jgi:hypothetical protein
MPAVAEARCFSSGPADIAASRTIAAAAAEKPASETLEDELRRVRAELTWVTEEHDFLIRHAVLREGKQVKYPVIQANVVSFSLQMMHYTRRFASGCYSWRNRKDSPRAIEDRELLAAIKDIHEAEPRNVWQSSGCRCA